MMFAKSAVSWGLMLFVWPLRAAVVDIDNAELARLTAAGVPLVDIRTAEEWRETGLVAGSRPITFADPRGRVDAPAWLAKIQAVAEADQPLILICRSGNRTLVASRLLSEQAGYRQVYNVKKGLLGWLGEGRPVISWR